jgi:hypothetical protein
MKYLTFIRHSESYRNAPPPPALMEAMGRFVERSFKDGTPRCGPCSTLAWAHSGPAQRTATSRFPNGEELKRCE